MSAFMKTHFFDCLSQQSEKLQDCATITAYMITGATKAALRV